MAVEQTGPNGLVVVDPGTQGTSHQYTLVLEPGPYIFSFDNLGTRRALAEWQIKPSEIDHENLTENGVGQSVALGLRLVNPITWTSTTGSSPGSSQLQDGVSTRMFPPALAALTLGLARIHRERYSHSGSLFVSANSGLLGGPSDTSGGTGDPGGTFPAGRFGRRIWRLGPGPGITGRWYESVTEGIHASRSRNGHDSLALSKVRRCDRASRCTALVRRGCPRPEPV